MTIDTCMIVPRMATIINLVKEKSRGLLKSTLLIMCLVSVSFIDTI